VAGSRQHSRLHEAFLAGRQDNKRLQSRCDLMIDERAPSADARCFHVSSRSRTVSQTASSRPADDKYVSSQRKPSSVQLTFPSAANQYAAAADTHTYVQDRTPEWRCTRSSICLFQESSKDLLQLVSLSCPLAPIPNVPDSLLRRQRCINHLRTYLLTYLKISYYYHNR